MANTSFAFNELVYPDQVELSSLKSWEWAVAQLDGQPDKILLHIAASNILTAANVAHDVRNFVDNAGSASGNGRARALLVAAILAGRVNTFVAKADTSKARALKPEVWRGNNRLCDPILMALSGVFAPAAGLLPAASIAAQLAGGDVYVENDQIQKLLEGNKRVSVVAMKRATDAVIAKLRAKNEQITEPDFTKIMKERTGATKSLISKQWSTVPSDLKFQGRPSNKEKVPPESQN
jgi:hypothetical protein